MRAKANVKYKPPKSAQFPMLSNTIHKSKCTKKKEKKKWFPKVLDSKSKQISPKKKESHLHVH